MQLCAVNFILLQRFHTHHQEYINCIYSLRYRSYIGAATFLERGRGKTNSATLEEGSCN